MGLKEHVEKRIQEVKDQKRFELADIEEFEPLIKEIVDGKACGFIIAAEFSDGIIMKVKSKPSKSLIKELIGYLE